MSTTLLDVRDVCLKFGGVAALSDVSFEVRQGETLGIIGPNGAGKSSLVNVLTGAYRPTSGSVRLDGQEVVGRSPAEIAGRGVVRTFQNLGLFDQMTVLENVLVGRHTRMTGGIVAAALRLPSTLRQERSAVERCEWLLAELDLLEHRDARVGLLPYGIKKRVEFAKALAADPRCIVLDEPVAGMNSEESERLAQIIRRVKTEFGASVVLIEHDIDMVMSLCDRVLVLDFGRRIAIGSPAEVQADPAVVAAYLGDVETGTVMAQSQEKEESR